MHLSTLIHFLALAAATSALTPQNRAAETLASPSDSTAPEPTPFLDPRQAPYNPDATAGPSQYPIATTNWVETSIPGGAVTYVPVAYTQKFSRVPDQLPSPGVGEIGYGTLQSGGGKVRRQEATATEEPVMVTGIADPSAFDPHGVAVLIRSALVIQPVQRARVLRIAHTVVETSLGTVFVDPSPPPEITPTSDASAGRPLGTGAPTYSAGNGTTALSGTSTGMYGTGTGTAGYGTGTGWPRGTGARIPLNTDPGLAAPTTYNRTLPLPARVSKQH